MLEKLKTGNKLYTSKQPINYKQKDKLSGSIAIQY